MAGAGDRPMMLAHGSGGDQNIGRRVAPAFEDRFAWCSSTTSAPGRQTSRTMAHVKLESPVRDLGIKVDDALEISEQIDL